MNLKANLGLPVAVAGLALCASLRQAVMLS